MFRGHGWLILIDVAAYAVVFPEVGIEITAGLAGKDQTAFRAETEAIAVLKGAYQFVQIGPATLSSLLTAFLPLM